MASHRGAASGDIKASRHSGPWDDAHFLNCRPGSKQGVAIAS